MQNAISLKVSLIRQKGGNLEKELFIKIVEQTCNSMVELLKKKGDDYSTTEDFLSNFKKSSELCSILRIDSNTPEGAAAFFIVHKLLRLCNLLSKKKTPENESVEDTINDLIGYSLCLKGLLRDKKELEEEKKRNLDVFRTD